MKNLLRTIWQGSGLSYLDRQSVRIEVLQLPDLVPFFNFMQHQNQSSSNGNQVFDYLQAMQIDRKINILRARIADKLNNTSESIDRDEFDEITTMLDVIVSVEHVQLLSRN